MLPIIIIIMMENQFQLVPENKDQQQLDFPTLLSPKLETLSQKLQLR